MSARIRKSVVALAAYVPGEQPRDPGIIKLNTNENPFPPTAAVMAAVRAFDPAALRRYPDPNCAALREALATLHGVRIEQIFVGNGSDEVLALCTRAFVEHGGGIGYFDTSYSLYPVLAAIQEAARRPVELGSDFAWQMPPDFSAALFFLANPNAPTGARFPDAEVESFCVRFPGVVVIDEAYVDFAGGDCLELAKRLPNVLVARTFSKSFSLAGLRVGYAVGSEALIGALFKIKDSYNVDAFSQSVALAAVRDVAGMRANAQRIRRTRERVRTALLTAGHQVSPSDANFLWFRPARGPDVGALLATPAGADQRCPSMTDALYAKEVFEGLRRLSIVVRHFPGVKTGGHLRVTVSTDGDMDRFLSALEKVIAGMGRDAKT